MSEAFIGEIRMFPMGNAPTVWLPCNGQIVSIQQYNALFTLIGTTFGGDGQTNFALKRPGLDAARGRAVRWGGDYHASKHGARES